MLGDTSSQGSHTSLGFLPQIDNDQPTMTAPRFLAVHLLVAAYAILGSSTQPQQRGGCFARVFSFGDSIIDNGNWLRYYASSPGVVASPPYGETFFHRPTGRFCDGRVIIDHIADALGIPFLTPYLAGNSSKDFVNGTNFAVGGATALGQEYFTSRNIDDGFVPYPLQTQISLLKNVTQMLSYEQGLNDVMATSLFLVGEIGGNDFNRALFRGKSVDEVTGYIPDIIAVISDSVAELIGLGAKTIVVPGNFPIGCSPGYLTKFRTSDTSQYDDAGCLRWANNLTLLHNAALKAELARIGRRHPDAAVLYADYYGAVLSIVADPGKQGFAGGGQTRVACCGGGGPYNVDFAVQCGAMGSTVCGDPGAAVSWDGFHFTEHVYKFVADGVMRGPYAVPPVGRLRNCRDRSVIHG